MPARIHRKILLWLALVLCLVSCDLVIKDSPPEPLAEVEYSDDWKFVTLYLDGATAESVASSSQQAAKTGRVMTADTARVGFDFFEAVFVSSGTIARVSWEYGSSASVNKVRRGVSYSHNGQDRAILFAGRCADKTLLAVGDIYSVDNVRGTRITESSSYVTFELHALTGGASYDPEISSFLLAADSGAQPAADTTSILPARIGTRDFPLYWLAGRKDNIRASFEFLLDGAEWDDFKSNMIISVPGHAYKREPRYSVGNNNYRYITYAYDTTTTVAMTNNQLIYGSVESPITFSFNTAKTVEVFPHSYLNGLFTLVFEIPIYAYTRLPGVEDDPAVDWAIRPAYTTYLYSMDNGIPYNVTTKTDDEGLSYEAITNIIGNWGGALLMGVNADVRDLVISVYSGK